MITIDLASAITPLTNVVEVYICEKDIVLLNESQWIDVAVSKPMFNMNLANVNANWGKHVVEFIEYHHQAMSYAYDKTNDGQKAVQRILETELAYKNYYMVGLREVTLPAHRFPCTKNIDCVQHVTRTVYTVSNRLALHVDHVQYKEDTTIKMYFRYNHSENVDLIKHTRDLQRALYHMGK